MRSISKISEIPGIFLLIVFSLDCLGQEYEFSFQKCCFLFMKWLVEKHQKAGSKWKLRPKSLEVSLMLRACSTLLSLLWLVFLLCATSQHDSCLLSFLPSWKLMWPWNVYVSFLFWFSVMQCLWRIRGNTNSSFIPHFLSSKLDNCFLPRKDKIPQPLLLLNSILLSLLNSEPPHNYYSSHETLLLDFLFFYLFLWIRGWNVSWKIIL